MATMLEVLADFTSGLNRDDVPPEVWAHAKKVLLDFVGVGLAGSRTEMAQSLLNVVARLGQADTSTLMGSLKRHAPFGAALYNGSSAHHHELDDGHVLAHTHPGVTTIPAVLALGERAGVSGAEVLLGIIAGYEVNIRLGDAITPSAVYGRGYHVPALIGAFSAAAAAARSLGLDRAATLRSMGCCCLSPAAAMETFRAGANIKDLYGGWPAAVGALAVDLAGAGFEGPSTLLEGKMGFLKAVTDDLNGPRVTQGLGSHWDILGVYCKKHAACSHAHTPIDATLAIREQAPGLRPEDVKEIAVHTYSPASELAEPQPKTPQAAKFSIPFCVGLALAHGAVGVDGFSPAMLKDPVVLAHASKVKVLLSPELDDVHRRNEGVRPSRVAVTLVSGTTLESYREVARGWPENPMTPDEFREKFESLAGQALSPGELREVHAAVMGLDSERSARSFMKLLARP